MTAAGGPEPMSPQDAEALEDVEDWKQRRLHTEDPQGAPIRLRDRISKAGAAARHRLENLPGADRFEAMFLDALRGLTDLGARAAHASIRREAILQAYRKRGHHVQTLRDIRRLDLSDITRVKPRLGVLGRYRLGATRRSHAPAPVPWCLVLVIRLLLPPEASRIGQRVPHRRCRRASIAGLPAPVSMRRTITDGSARCGCSPGPRRGRRTGRSPR